MALRGRSLAAIATAMNNSGWRTNPGKGKVPGEWRPEQVLAILKNPRYAGLSAWNGEVLAREAWPAYITERQHYRLQARLTHARTAKAPPRREAYLLRGFATCGRCGSNLHAVSARARPDGSVPRSYVCRRRKWRYGKVCEQRPINADLLEQMFAASLPALLARGRDSDVAAMPDLSEQRQRILQAARAHDSERLDAAIEQGVNLSHDASHSQKEEQARRVEREPREVQEREEQKQKEVEDASLSQQNALKSAEEYLQTSAFSEAGLIEQLSSEAGSKYPHADAVWAVEHLQVDWNQQAVKAATEYLSTSSFSCQGLTEQLDSEAGSKFTAAQAEYAAHQVGLC